MNIKLSDPMTLITVAVAILNWQNRNNDTLDGYIDDLARKEKYGLNDNSQNCLNLLRVVKSCVGDSAQCDYTKTSSAPAATPAQSRWFLGWFSKEPSVPSGGSAPDGDIDIGSDNDSISGFQSNAGDDYSGKVMD